MKHLVLKMALFIICAISAGLMGCSGSSGNSDNGAMVNSGSWYVTGWKCPHDGNPLESENFVIYSDAASLEARQLLSEICEETFVRINVRLSSMILAWG